MNNDGRFSTGWTPLRAWSCTVGCAPIRSPLPLVRIVCSAKLHREMLLEQAADVLTIGDEARLGAGRAAGRMVAQLFAYLLARVAAGRPCCRLSAFDCELPARCAPAHSISSAEHSAG